MRGADIMLELCRRAEREGVPVALIGVKSEALLGRLRQALAKRFHDIIARAMGVSGHD